MRSCHRLASLAPPRVQPSPRDPGTRGKHAHAGAGATQTRNRKIPASEHTALSETVVQHTLIWTQEAERILSRDRSASPFPRPAARDLSSPPPGNPLRERLGTARRLETTWRALLRESSVACPHRTRCRSSHAHHSSLLPNTASQELYPSYYQRNPAPSPCCIIPPRACTEPQRLIGGPL